MPDPTLNPDDIEQDEQEPIAPRLTPMPWPPPGYTPGKIAPWFCGAQENGKEEIYGPDELGEYVSAIEQLTQNVNKTYAAARIWEVLQAWEMRLFRRNYQFLNVG